MADSAARPPREDLRQPRVKWTNNNDSTRGWDPIDHDRFRVPLQRHFGDEIDVDDRLAFLLPGELEEELGVTPFISEKSRNIGNAEGPHVEFNLEAVLVNSINGAYTSSGYPSIITSGQAQGDVFGSFVDLRNPSVCTLNLPPEETIVIAPDYIAENLPGQGKHTTSMETLLRIIWRRGEQVFRPEKQESLILSAVRADEGGASLGVESSLTQKPIQRPPGASESGLRQILQQHPEGVHAVHSAPDLRDMLLKGKFPKPPQAASSATNENPSESSGAGIPLAPLLPTGTAPVQHTLVSVNTFNHLSFYLVAHQNGILLDIAPLLTLSISIASRKVTAQMLFMLGCEEVRPIVGSDSMDSPERPCKFASQNRDHNVFEDTYITKPEDQDFFFNPKHSNINFVDANVQAKTISVVNINLVFEPLLVFGNQNGDIFIFSIFEKRVVQRLNFTTASPETQSTMVYGAGLKIVSAPVSCLQEVQNGIEKELQEMVTRAGIAKRARKSSFQFGTSIHHDPFYSRKPLGISSPSGCEGVGNFSLTSSMETSHHSLHPTIFAAGFDNGHVLLLCVVASGAWLLRHFDNQTFGYHSIRCIAPRIPPFFTRLWTHYNSPTACEDEADSLNSNKGANRPRTSLITLEELLFIDEEQHVAAISCNSGTIALVKLPGFDILSRISVYEYNTVGEIIALFWASSTPFHLLTPDLLISSGEDDMLGIFHFTPICAENSFLSNSFNRQSQGPFERSAQLETLSGLQVLHRKRAHRSWVSHLCGVPLVAPTSLQAAGAPTFLGCCLIATSYDARTSFWPILAKKPCPELPGGGGDGVALADGPTASLRLHVDMTTACGVGGGGGSFFLVTTCCRGKVKFWSIQVKLAQS
ncbi:unnamed protein product [Phytomonas sp. EM1]|nr:unnamed protein product [Phytomonas sp. EM1]|eukprot:CCW64181.1 unnamed protein product [Phytomonas sp. isolate EM1]